MEHIHTTSVNTYLSTMKISRLVRAPSVNTSETSLNRTPRCTLAQLRTQKNTIFTSIHQVTHNPSPHCPFCTTHVYYITHLHLRTCAYTVDGSECGLTLRMSYYWNLEGQFGRSPMDFFPLNSRGVV